MADFSDLCAVVFTCWEIIICRAALVNSLWPIFKDYSFSHGLNAIFFLYHHAANNVGRYLVTVASVCLSVCLVTLFLSAVNKGQYLIELLFLESLLLNLRFPK